MVTLNGKTLFLALLELHNSQKTEKEFMDGVEAKELTAEDKAILLKAYRELNSEFSFDKIKKISDKYEQEEIVLSHLKRVQKKQTKKGEN